MDGGWWAGSDTGHVIRNKTGFPQYNPEKYPEGIKHVIDYIHSKGFKYGHYTDSGKHACNGDKPMSEGYELQDAQQFVAWGADMVKVDACGATEPAEVLMRRWMTDLNRTGHPVLFSNCHNGCESPEWQPWCAEVSNMWRTSRDIASNWNSVMVREATFSFPLVFLRPAPHPPATHHHHSSTPSFVLRVATMSGRTLTFNHHTLPFSCLFLTPQVNAQSLKGMGAHGAPGHWNGTVGPDDLVLTLTQRSGLHFGPLPCCRRGASPDLQQPPPSPCRLTTAPADPDFLEVGNGDFVLDGTQRNFDENVAHFSIWVIASAPLIAGHDVTRAPAAITGILTNKVAIEINQAYAGNAGDLLPSTSSSGVVVVGGDGNGVVAQGLPPRPHPALRSCANATAKARWEMDKPALGNICDPATQTECFNVQDCKDTIILWAPSHSCKNNTASLFSISQDGKLVPQMAPEKCVGPTPTGELKVVDDCSGTWTYNQTSKLLKYHDGASALCATAEPPNNPTKSPEIWYKPLPDSAAAVLLFNPQDSGNATMRVAFQDLPSLGDGRSCMVEDVWTGETVTASESYTASSIRPHAVALLRISNCQ